jgi:hydrogenase maturation protease
MLHPLPRSARGADLSVVIGIGQALAGDDGVGLVVARELRSQGAGHEVTIVEIAEPTRMISHLLTSERVVVVDAIVAAGPPGEIVTMDAGSLAARGLRGVSSHGVGVVEAIALARALYPGLSSCDVRIVGVCIDRPSVGQHTLTPRVGAAVAAAIAAVRAALEPRRRPSPASVT